VKTESYKWALLSILVIASIIALAIPLLSTGTVHAALTPHGPIEITNNSGFTKPDPVNGGGSGTENDPYIIENWDISANTTDGIYIDATTAHFIIRNCYVRTVWSEYGYSGIRFSYVINGILDNNTVENNSFGIELADSNNNLISGNIVEKNGRGIYFYFSANDLVSGNIVENNSDGIYIQDSDNNILSGNEVENNVHTAIYLDTSDNNLIYNNLISGNEVEDDGRSAIYFDTSNNNRIENNTCENNYRGISLDSSDNIKMRNNILSNNLYNFGVFGSGYSHFVQDIDTSNLVNGKPIRYLVDNKNEIIGPSLQIGYLGMVNCDNILVENLAIGNEGQGILLAFTENSRVENCTLENNLIGISLVSYSDNNLVANNTVRNSEIGIYLYYSSDNNLISGNIAENNRYGIFLQFYSSNNLVSGNLVKNSSLGIYLDYQSDNNLIYHNNLMNNTSQAYDEGSNYWDNGYPSGGNYWSDYIGADDYHGENQNILGSDGIGDNQYYIPGTSNKDRYPLMNPWPQSFENYFNIYLQAGWNLVGFPRTNENLTPTSFPSDLFKPGEWTYFDSSTMSYKTPPAGEPLKLGIGYWVKAKLSTTVPISGISVENYVLSFTKGWNLISLPVTSDNTTPNSFPSDNFKPGEWTYFDASTMSYRTPPADQPLEVGVGYWVKAADNITVTIPL
jgi:parallel beta-helix repeat protein